MAQRHVTAVTVEQFCTADARGEWQTRHVVNGMTILQYPRAIMICCGGGRCSLIAQAGTNMEAYIDEALEELEAVA